MDTQNEIVVASVLSLVIFEIWKAYDNSAPALADLRASDKDNLSLRQRIIDTDFTVGSIAIAVGLIFAIKANDPYIIYIVIALIFALSWWRYQILEGEVK